MGFLSRLFGSSPRLSPPSALADHRSASWRFDQAPMAAAITTRQVIEGTLPVQVVVHYADDHAWAFLCGTTDAPEDGRVISMQAALELDGSLVSVADLPPGWKAWRERPGAAWVSERCDQA